MGLEWFAAYRNIHTVDADEFRVRRGNVVAALEAELAVLSLKNPVGYRADGELQPRFRDAPEWVPEDSGLTLQPGEIAWMGSDEIQAQRHALSEEEVARTFEPPHRHSYKPYGPLEVYRGPKGGLVDGSATAYLFCEGCGDLIHRRSRRVP